MYDAIARYYDLTHDNLKADISFVVDLASRLDGDVLELGCGSGRLLLPLARAGHSVAGVDSSPVMLERARRRLAGEEAAVIQRVELLEADMTDLPKSLASRHFSLFMLPYNTAMHLDTGQLARTLSGCVRLVSAGGRVLIDVINPFVLAEAGSDGTISLEDSFDDPERGEYVLQMASHWQDEEAQRLDITWIYDAVPAAGGPVRRTIAHSSYHYHFPHQWELLLHQSGLKLESLLGDYDGSAFDEESERLLILAGAR